MKFEIYIPILFFFLNGLAAFSQKLTLADSFFESHLYANAIREYDAFILKNFQTKTLDIGNAWLRKGTSLSFLDRFHEAMPCYIAALKVFENINNKERINTTYKNIGFIYSTKGNYIKAREYYEAAYKGFKQLNDSAKIAALLNDLAAVNYYDKKFQSAISLLKEALYIYSGSIKNELKWNIVNSLAINYQKVNYDSCLSNYLLAESLAGQDSALLLTTYVGISDMYLQGGQFRKALFYLTECLRFIESFDYGSADDRSTVYHNLADVYDSLGNHKMAYKYVLKERSINDSLYNISHNKIDAELNEKYESGKKDEKIKNQEIENKLKSRNLLLSLGGLALVAALAILSFINYQRKQKANKILQSQNEKIEALNKELDASNQVKTKLFSVISHDLRSPISSLYAYLQIKNKAVDTTDKAIIDQTEQLLETLEDLLVWSKSQLHQFVPSIESINLHRLCNDAISLIKSVATTKELQVVNAIPENLSIKSDQNILTIVVRNLLANAAKYALPKTAIAIEAVQSDAIQLIVSNETGIENASLLTSLIDMPVTSSKSGMGMMLIKEFVEKLKGNFSYTVHSNKVVATITLPA